MIGLKFEIENKYDTFLGKIFKNIDFKNSFWKIENEEVLIEKGKDFFEKRIYSDSEFKEKTMQKKYYPIFLTLQLYSQNGKTSKINNYNDYLNSDCVLILYIIDNIFVEIYSKNKNYLKYIKQNAINNKYINIQDIENEHDFSLYY